VREIANQGKKKRAGDFRGQRRGKKGLPGGPVKAIAGMDRTLREGGRESVNWGKGKLVAGG